VGESLRKTDCEPLRAVVLHGCHAMQAIIYV